MPSPAVGTARRPWPTLSGPTPSWPPTGPVTTCTATTSCSPACCAASSDARRRARSPSGTRPPPHRPPHPPPFPGLLRCEPRRQAPGEVAELHRRAAGWYAAHGLVVNAIGQALAAEEWGYAADLTVEHGLGLILRSDAGTLEELLGRLPADLVQAEPE